MIPPSSDSDWATLAKELEDHFGPATNSWNEPTPVIDRKVSSIEYNFKECYICAFGPVDAVTNSGIPICFTCMKQIPYFDSITVPVRP